MHTMGVRWRGKFAVACLLAGMACGALAQGRGGGPGGGSPPGSGGPGRSGGMGNSGGFGDRTPPPPPRARQDGTGSTARNGLQMGPAARWWDDKKFAKDLKLRPEQVTRMDAVFEGNREALLKSYESLQQEQQKLEALEKANVPEEQALDAQIDRVNQARGELAKANTRLQLELRKQMDADQITQLEKHK